MKTSTAAALLFGALSFSGTRARADIEYDTAILLTTPRPAYDIMQDRPALNLRTSTGGAINNAGQLTGLGDAGANQSNNDARPFFYDHQEQTTANLGDLSGDFGDDAVFPRNDVSRAMALNDSGWVVGVSSTSTVAGLTDDRPFLWSDVDGNHANTPGEMHELALNPGAAYGSALRVNNAGQVLINGATGLYRAGYTLSAGVPTESAPRTRIAASADSADLNNLGDIAFNAGSTGYVWRDLNTDNATNPGEVTQIPAMSADSPATAVFAINNAGQAVGTMRNANGREIAYLWSDLDGDNLPDWDDTNSNGYFEHDETSSEIVRFHGDPGGINAETGRTYLFDINDRGVAVGTYFEASDRKAFIYDAARGMRFLHDLTDPLLPIELRQADTINNAGQIAGVGKNIFSAANQLFMLDPITDTLPGDLDGDGFVGLNDLDIILRDWNQSAPDIDPAADPTGDGFVGLDDLDIVLGNWNTGTPATIADTDAVPEPGAVCLFGAGGLALLKRRHA